MKRFNNKDLKKEQYYFILYDNSDSICCYFDSINEFLKISNIKFKELNRKFNSTLNDYITININHSLFNLYIFSDEI